MPRKDGTFKEMKRINNNSYKIYLQGSYTISSSFSMSDFILFIVDELDLSSNPLKGQGDCATKIGADSITNQYRRVKAHEDDLEMDGDELDLDVIELELEDEELNDPKEEEMDKLVMGDGGAAA